MFQPGESLKDYVNQICANEGVFEEIGALLDFVRNQNGDEVRKARERWAEGYISNKMRWLFLKPGIDVYCDVEATGDWETYVVKSVSPRYSGKEEIGASIFVWKLVGDNETTFLYVTNMKFYRDCSSTECKISKDWCVPCDVAERNEEMVIMGRTGKEIRRSFEQRGKEYCSLRRKGCFGYDGLTRTPPIRPVRFTLLLYFQSG